MRKNTFNLITAPALATCLSLAFLATTATAQSASPSICEDGDCPPAVFDVQIDEPLVPDGGYDSGRTERFKKVYDQFQKIKSTYANNTAWQSKYKASQIGGKNCLRHYQLESLFANEYIKNPDFKTYIDGLGKGGEAFTQSGFDNARKGINLKTRMENTCQPEVKKVEGKPGPKLDDLPKNYQQLGRELGYFDEKGNLLKPINIPEEEKNAAQEEEKLSKKQQIDQLKDKVAALPVGQQAKDKIDGLANDLETAKLTAGNLSNVLKTLDPTATSLLGAQLPLADKLGKVTGFLGGLLNWKPKLPRLGLPDKIKGLFDKGKALKDRADGLLGQSRQFQDKIRNLGKKAQQLQDDIDNKIKNVGAIKDELDALQKNKEELAAQLEDKPRKILDELNGAVAIAEKKAKDLVDKAIKEASDKDKLLKELEDLEKEKDDLLAEQKKLEQEVEDLSTAGDALQQEADAVGKEVEAAKEEEAKLQRMEQDLAQLPSDEKLKEKLKICEDDLKRLLSQMDPAAKIQNQIKAKFNDLKDKPDNLFQKIKNLKGWQEKLKVPKIDVPLADKTLKKIDGLLEKAGMLGSTAELLTGKKSRLQEKIQQIDQKFSTVQAAFDNRGQKLEKLKGDLLNLISEKSGLKGKFDQATDQLEGLEKSYQDFIQRYKVFDEESKCVDLKTLEDKITDLKKDQEPTAPELAKMEEELKDIEQQTEQLETETQKAEELIQEEQVIKEEYGADVALDPVQPEEWTESFEVKRDYWEAVFHPDDEVVEGYRGRYFQVRLKDAEKKVKLLFGSGEYFMDKATFRDNYGSVIGAFVTEALNAFRQSERNGIKLFVQGSADITGQNTFKGNLDSKFRYHQVVVLPQKEGTDHFEAASRTLDIPEKGFTNKDLPNLRGNFLREMISIYSRKLEPVLLEGSVTDVVDKEDRNAVIYLFIPEALVNKYNRD